MIRRAFRLAAAIAVVFSSALAHAKEAGIYSPSGCSCHGSSSSSAQVSISAPSPIFFGQSADVSVSVVDNSVSGPAGAAQGGFALEASQGMLSDPTLDCPDVPTNLNCNIRTSTNQATHTLAGNKFRQWTIHWNPPSSLLVCKIDFQGAANAVNGDGQDTGDQWNTATASLHVVYNNDHTPPPPPTIVSPEAGRTYINNVRFNVPSGQTIVIGNLTIRVVAVDTESGIDHVEIFDENVSSLGQPGTLGEATYDQDSGEFLLTWNSAASPPGPHTLTVQAFDCGGNSNETKIDIFVL